MVVTAVIAGASGGALANVALSPLGGGAGLLQSYWYGAGLILGERDMYTFHWEKIKKRLEGGEDYLSVLEAEMNPAITAIANYSLQVMQKTGAIYMQGGIDFMAKLIENMFKLLAGETIEGQIESAPLVPVGETVDGVTLPPVQVSPSPTSTPEPTFTPPLALQNFSNIPIALQTLILGFMKEINRLAILRLKQTPAVRGSLLSSIRNIITMWKTQYISIKGYKNPLPSQAMPWLEADIQLLLKGWETLV